MTATLVDEEPNVDGGDEGEGVPDTSEENPFLAFLKELWQKIVAFFRWLIFSDEEK